MGDQIGLSNAEANSLCKDPDPFTKVYMNFEIKSFFKSEYNIS